MDDSSQDSLECLNVNLVSSEMDIVDVCEENSEYAEGFAKFGNSSGNNKQYNITETKPTNQVYSFKAGFCDDKDHLAIFNEYITSQEGRKESLDQKKNDKQMVYKKYNYQKKPSKLSLSEKIFQSIFNTKNKAFKDDVSTDGVGKAVRSYRESEVAFKNSKNDANNFDWKKDIWDPYYHDQFVKELMIEEDAEVNRKLRRLEEGFESIRGPANFQNFAKASPNEKKYEKTRKRKVENVNVHLPITPPPTIIFPELKEDTSKDPFIFIKMISDNSALPEDPNEMPKPPPYGLNNNYSPEFVDPLFFLNNQMALASALKNQNDDNEIKVEKYADFQNEFVPHEDDVRPPIFQLFD